MKIKLSLVAINICLLSYAQEVKVADIDIHDKSILEQTLSNTKTTINVEDDIQASSINETLKKQFYVEFKKSSEYSSEPYIRGRGNKGVPVFLEGMRINAGHDDSTNIFGLSDIAQIDVYRGANGAKLGMGATSGAVVVKFKDPVFNDNSEFKISGFANAKSSFLSKDGYSSSLGTNLYNDLISLSLSGGLSDYNNYENGANEEVLHSEYDTKNYNGMLAVKTSSDSYFYGRYMKDEADSSDPYSRWLNPLNNTWTYFDRPNDESKTYFIGFKKEKIGEFKNLDIQYFNNDSHYDYNVKKEATNPNQQELFRDSQTKGLKISVNKTLDKHNLEFSTKYSKMDISNGVRQYLNGSWTPWQNAFGIKQGEIESYMLGVSDDIYLDKAFFNLALGYEHIKRDVKSNINTAKYTNDGLIPDELMGEIIKDDTNEKDNLLSISATAGYEFSPAFIPYIKLSNATRTPYFNEQYANNPSNGSQIPNQDLENEKVYGIDFGIDGQISKLNYSTAVYYQKYKDYIELVNTGYTTTTNLPIKQYINLDDAQIYGLEALLGFNLTQTIYAQASYTYTRGENKEHNQPLAYITPQKLTLSISEIKPKGLNWSIEQEFVSKQDRISSINGEKQTSGYGLTNTSIAYKFGNFSVFKSVSLSFELNNIFDKNYKEHLSKASSTAYYIPNEAGINGSLALNLKF